MYTEDISRSEVPPIVIGIWKMPKVMEGNQGDET